MTLVSDAPGRRRRVEALAVLVGGAVGTGLRESIVAITPVSAGRFPTAAAILGINLSGSFLLALLVATLAARGPDGGRNRRLRLLLGTGVCGGFTTYSSLALGLTDWLGSGRFWPAAGYAVVTLLLGAGASWLGLRLGPHLGARVGERR